MNTEQIDKWLDRGKRWYIEVVELLALMCLWDWFSTYNVATGLMLALFTAMSAVGVHEALRWLARLSDNRRYGAIAVLAAMSLTLAALARFFL